MADEVINCVIRRDVFVEVDGFPIVEEESEISECLSGIFLTTGRNRVVLFGPEVENSDLFVQHTHRTPVDTVRWRVRTRSFEEHTPCDCLISIGIRYLSREK